MYQEVNEKKMNKMHRQYDEQSIQCGLVSAACVSLQHTTEAFDQL